MMRLIYGGVTLSVTVLIGLTLSTPSVASTSSAGAQKHLQTVRCTRTVTGHQTISKNQVASCNASSLRVTHPCPKGSSTIFVVVHNRTYALRVGHSPERLAKQYGMGTITQACGIPVAAPATPTTTATTAAPASIPTTTAPPPPTTAPTPSPSTTSAPASCYPLTDGGNCYQPGEYCRNSDHGATGRAGDGETIVCQDNNGWRWEPT